MNQHFIFLSKEATLVPQSLNDPDASAIVRSLLLQDFNLLPAHLTARNSKEALETYRSTHNNNVSS